MLGFSLQFWQSAVVWATVIAAVAGGISVFAAFTSGIVGYRLSDLSQADANKRISEANVRAEEAKERAAAANAEAARANEAAANAHARAAELERDAAQARAEQERIKSAVGWRELSARQRHRIRAVLGTRRMDITISWYSGDPESLLFAEQFAKVFMAAGSEIAAFAPIVSLGEQKFGLAVSGSEIDEIDTLVSALTAAELGPIAVQKDARKAGGTKSFTHLFVGFRAAPSLP